MPCAASLIEENTLCLPRINECNILFLFPGGSEPLVDRSSQHSNTPANADGNNRQFKCAVTSDRLHKRSAAVCRDERTSVRRLSGQHEGQGRKADCRGF